MTIKGKSFIEINACAVCAFWQQYTQCKNSSRKFFWKMKTSSWEKEGEQKKRERCEMKLGQIFFILHLQNALPDAAAATLNAWCMMRVPPIL